MTKIEAINLYNRYEKWLKPEAKEQALLVIWLEENGYKFTAIPNSTWTKSIKQRIVNTMTGVRPGLCDMMIILKRNSLLFIELKKEKGIKGGLNGSKIGPEQEKWIEALSRIDNVDAVIAHGCEEAKNYITLLENQ